MDASYYCHSSYGRIAYDLNKGHKHYEPWWAFILVQPDIIDYYRWLSLKWGITIEKSVLWGPHISIIKGDEPKNDGWGKSLSPVKFFYSNIMRSDNGVHAWLDVYSDEINQIRLDLGLGPKHKFHMTLGRLR